MMRKPFSNALLAVIGTGLLGSALAKAETIPPNPFVSRLEAEGSQDPTLAEDPVAKENSTIAAYTDLSVVGVVSNGSITILTLRMGPNRLISVSVGDQVDDIITLLEISDHYASFKRADDGQMIRIALPRD